MVHAVIVPGLPEQAEASRAGRVKKILLAWVLTLPATLLMAALFYAIARALV